MGKVSSIYLLSGKQTVCPECSGALQRNYSNRWYSCIDCRALYRVKGAGESEKEIVCEKVNRLKRGA